MSYNHEKLNFTAFIYVLEDIAVMTLDDLSPFNPWWEDKQDPHIATLSKYEITVTPSWIKDISLNPHFLNVISGPKCVGKTTGIKLLIADLLKRVGTEDVLYVNCEALLDPISLRITLEEYLKKHKEAHIFIDEISAIKGLWDVLRHLIDGDLMSYSSVVLTTSNAQVLGNILSKKRKVINIRVLPMSFPEFIEVHGITEYKSRYDDVMMLFGKYLTTGGFLGAINGVPLENIIREYVVEIIRAGKNPSIMRNVVASLINSMPPPISFRGLAKNMPKYSYKLVQDYLETLRGLYVIDYAYLKEGGDVYYKRERKVFFRDPLLMRIFSFLSGIKPFESVIYENIVQEHVYRALGEVYYYKDSYEIDVMAGEFKLGIKAGKPKTRYPKGVTVLDKEDLPIFLLELFR